MNTSTWLLLRRGCAALLLVLAPVAVLLCWLLARNDLPSRVATHFGLDGRPDSYSAPGGFALGFGVVALVLAVLGIVGLVLARRQSVVRTAVALAGWMAWLFAAIVVSVLWRSRDTAADAVRHGWLSTLACLLVASVLGLAIYRLVPAGVSTLSTTPQATPSYTLTPGERATWVGRANSRIILAIGIVLGVVGALGTIWFGGWSVVVAGVGLIMGWTSEILVRVDDRGVSAHFGPVGWPRWRTPLSRIEAVRAEQIEPLQWGGWGYRVGRRGTALVVRRGPGLVLSRRGASDLAITVDDADRAAELVNALLARAHTH
jgi:hypothetical protein